MGSRYLSHTERDRAVRPFGSTKLGTRVYVRNFAIGTTEDSVRSVFARAGQVRDVRIISNRETGRPRGFAFVTMASHAEATRAIAAMNGKLLDGRPLRVSLDRRATAPARSR
jgi:RNA recognition motif-containing protein